ncbi:hypothetical protein SuNHUV7_02910 (plasmid) [Pseudoseohaeicola sp. NH-UV-7]
MAADATVPAGSTIPNTQSGPSKHAKFQGSEARTLSAQALDAFTRRWRCPGFPVEHGIRRDRCK